MAKVIRMHRDMRRIYLVIPTEYRDYPGGVSRCVVQAKSKKEVGEILFGEKKKEDRIPVKIEEIGVCPNSVFSYVVCTQPVIQTEEGDGDGDGEVEAK